MSWKKGLLGAGLAALLVVAGTAGPAQAASVPGGCSASGYNGNGVTHYSRLTGGIHRITKFEYRLQHSSSTRGKSNTNIRHYENRRLGSDRLMYTWNSPDNRKFGTNYTHTPDVTVQLDYLKEMFTNYTFIFDRSGPDPRCTARTPDIGL